MKGLKVADVIQLLLTAWSTDPRAFFFFFLQFMVLQHLIAGCVFTSSWRGLLVNDFPLNSVEDDEDNESHKGANPGSI